MWLSHGNCKELQSWQCPAILEKSETTTICRGDFRVHPLLSPTPCPARPWTQTQVRLQSRFPADIASAKATARPAGQRRYGVNDRLTDWPQRCSSSWCSLLSRSSLVPFVDRPANPALVTLLVGNACGPLVSKQQGIGFGRDGLPESRIKGRWAEGGD